MRDTIRLACETEILQIPMKRILATRRLDETIHKSVKYNCIKASIQELGLIEPLVVYPQKGKDGTDFILIDGHVRFKILQSEGATTAKCLISTDDEGFTYNHKVNRLSSIQEHFMILTAIKNGVSEERIARCLDVDVKSIVQKRDLLNGICPEVVLLLKDKHATTPAVREIRKVKPIRQIEIAELMCAAHIYTVGYVKCLVAATSNDLLVDNERSKDPGFSSEEISRMEHEMETLGKEFKLLEETHGKNTLNLVIVVGYLI